MGPSWSMRLQHVASGGSRGSSTPNVAEDGGSGHAHGGGRIASSSLWCKPGLGGGVLCWLGPAACPPCAERGAWWAPCGRAGAPVGCWAPAPAVPAWAGDRPPPSPNAGGAAVPGDDWAGGMPCRGAVRSAGEGLAEPALGPECQSGAAGSGSGLGPGSGSRLRAPPAVFPSSARAPAVAAPPGGGCGGGEPCPGVVAGGSCPATGGSHPPVPAASAAPGPVSEGGAVPGGAWVRATSGRHPGQPRFSRSKRSGRRAWWNQWSQDEEGQRCIGQRSLCRQPRHSRGSRLLGGGTGAGGPFSWRAPGA